ncbi:MAG: hypothetical protein IJ973_02250, partial [Christensenellaceae bacterium]|nr:hypothetical protein [Christensenellaceae bacterium]
MEKEKACFFSEKQEVNTTNACQFLPQTLPGVFEKPRRKSKRSGSAGSFDSLKLQESSCNELMIIRNLQAFCRR